MHPSGIAGPEVVVSECDATESTCRIVIRPNCSLSSSGALLFFGSIAFVSLTIASVLAWQGAWLVLPFAGLELAGLGAALLVIRRDALQWEVVSVEEDTVAVLRRRGTREESFSFQRYWARTRLVPRRYDPGKHRLYIHSHGSGVEVGAFLNESERQGLARELARLFARPATAGV